MGVLMKCKNALGWTIANIKGISHSVCMHKIIIKYGEKPTRDAKLIEPNHDKSVEMVKGQHNIPYLQQWMG